MRKKKQVLVSVVMPVYNNEKYVSEAIESILNQSYTNFEFIIIDDCSTDNSWQVIKRFAKKDNRIRCYRNEKNLKIVKTRNKGLDLCNKNSKYYAPMDSDDIAISNRLEKEVNFLEENKEYVAVGSNIILIDENSKKIGYRKYPQTYNKIKKIITRYSPMAQPSTLIRKDILLKEGKYNEKYTRSQDYELWMRLANKYKIKNLGDYLLKYRITETQGKTTHLKQTIKFTLNIQKKYLFKPKFFNPLNIIYFIGKFILLILPKGIVLRLFKMVTYKK